MLMRGDRLNFCVRTRVLRMGVLGKNAGGWIKWGDRDRCKVEADQTSIKSEEKMRVNHMTIRAAVSPNMKQMKTRMVFFAGAAAVAMGMTLMAPAASAQQVASQATIPFAFSVNHQVFPAGHYRVVMESENEVRLVSYETRDSAGVVVHTTRSIKNSPENNLEFVRDDEGYELTKVRFGQGLVQTEVALQSKAEREIAKATQFTRTSISTR